MGFELIISVVALIIAGLALVVSIEQSNLAKTANRLALRKDYVDNYNLVSKAFGEWGLKNCVTNEFRTLIPEALRHSKLPLTTDITKFLEDLDGNVWDIIHANIYIKGENDNLQPDAVKSWNENLEIAKEKYAKVTKQINDIVFNKELNLIERYSKYTKLPDSDDFQINIKSQ